MHFVSPIPIAYSRPRQLAPHAWQPYSIYFCQHGKTHNLGYSSSCRAAGMKLCSPMRCFEAFGTDPKLYEVRRSRRHCRSTPSGRSRLSLEVLLRGYVGGGTGMSGSA